MIAGTVMLMFILGLFFSMLGQQPKKDPEWQNDTDRELAATPAVADQGVPVAHV